MFNCAHGIAPSVQRERVRPPNAAKPVPCSFGLMAHPLELAACPSNDIGIDPLGSGRCERIEGTTSGKDIANRRPTAAVGSVLT